MTIVKRAEWKYKDGSVVHFTLHRIERACFRWMTAAGNLWDGVDYLDTGTALKAMRVHVDSDPAEVGTDLTFFDIAPGPERRAAETIDRIFNAGLTGEEYRTRCAEVISTETNIGPMTQAFSELIAFLFTRRTALCFGLALAAMPPQIIAQANAMIQATGQTPGRDLVFDGLLYAAIEEMSKSTGQDFSNLLKPLKEPVSNIVVARAVPKTPGGVQ